MMQEKLLVSIFHFLLIILLILIIKIDNINNYIYFLHKFY